MTGKKKRKLPLLPSAKEREKAKATALAYYKQKARGDKKKEEDDGKAISTDITRREGERRLPLFCCCL